MKVTVSGSLAVSDGVYESALIHYKDPEPKPVLTKVTIIDGGQEKEIDPAHVTKIEA